MLQAGSCNGVVVVTVSFDVVCVVNFCFCVLLLDLYSDVVVLYEPHYILLCDPNV